MRIIPAALHRGTPPWHSTVGQMYTPSMRSLSLQQAESSWLETQWPATATPARRSGGVRRRTPEQQPMRQTVGAAGAAEELTGLYRTVHRCPMTTRHSASSNVVGYLAAGDYVEAVEARAVGARARPQLPTSFRCSTDRTQPAPSAGLRLRVWTRHSGTSLSGCQA